MLDTRKASSSGRRPVVQMASVAVFDAVLALVIVTAVGSDPPLMWMAGLYTGLLVGSTGYLAISHSDILFSRASWREILTPKHLANKEMLLTAAGRFDWALFAWATVYISGASATIIRAAGPIFFVFFVRKAVQVAGAQPRYGRLNFETLTFIVISLAGLAFVVIADGSGGDHGGSDNLIWAGLLLAFLCAVSVGFNSFNLLWGINARKSVSLALRSSGTRGVSVDGHIEVGVTVLGITLAGVLVPLTLSVVAFAVPGSGVSVGSFLIAVAAGIGLNAPGLILFRKANLGTDRLGINALKYLTPVLALGLLAVFGEIGRVRSDFIVLGVTAIISMNLLLNFEAAAVAFKASIAALWCSGVAFYMRDEWFPSLPREWDGWSALTVDAVGVAAITAGVCLIVCSVSGRHKQATASHGRTSPEPNMPIVEQVISAVVAVSMVGAFVGLLCVKWLA